MGTSSEAGQASSVGQRQVPEDGAEAHREEAFPTPSRGGPKQGGDRRPGGLARSRSRTGANDRKQGRAGEGRGDCCEQGLGAAVHRVALPRPGAEISGSGSLQSALWSHALGDAAVANPGTSLWGPPMGLGSSGLVTFHPCLPWDLPTSCPSMPCTTVTTSPPTTGKGPRES